MTVNHGVPGSSPGEGAQSHQCQVAFLFLNFINEFFKQKALIYLQKLCAFYREEPTLKNGYNQFNLRPKKGI